MTARRVSPAASPTGRNRWPALALAASALAAGFLLVQMPPAIAAFRFVTEAMAIGADALLRLAGFDVLRTGVELRNLTTGRAVAVTAACDGSGLIISAAAVAFWLHGRAMTAARVLAAIGLALAAIFAFNLLRVIVLFVSLDWPSLLEVQHLYIAPLLSAVLIAAVVARGRGMPPDALVRAPFVWLGLAVVAAGAWYFVSAPATCAAVVPVAGAAVATLAGDLVRGIVCSPDGVSLVTAGELPGQAGAILSVPFYPADFTLALPLVVASLAFARSPAQAAIGAVASLVLFALAMAAAAVNTAHDAIAAAGVTRLIGEGFVQAYNPPDEVGHALLRTAQNGLVHFNLFLLPLLLLTPPPEAPAAGRTRPAPRPHPAGGRRSAH